MRRIDLLLLLVSERAEAKLARHGVTLAEVEQIPENAAEIQRNTGASAIDGSYYLVGRTNGGRVIKLVVVPDDDEPGTWHVVTGWPR